MWPLLGHPVDILYIILKESSGDSDSIYIFQKYFDFAILPAIFAKWIHLCPLLDMYYKNQTVRKQTSDTMYRVSPKKLPTFKLK